jgi:hypothetical protein
MRREPSGVSVGSSRSAGAAGAARPLGRTAAGARRARRRRVRSRRRRSPCRRSRAGPLAVAARVRPHARVALNGLAPTTRDRLHGDARRGEGAISFDAELPALRPRLRCCESGARSERGWRCVGLLLDRSSDRLLPGRLLRDRTRGRRQSHGLFGRDARVPGVQPACGERPVDATAGVGLSRTLPG